VFVAAVVDGEMRRRKKRVGANDRHG